MGVMAVVRYLIALFILMGWCSAAALAAVELDVDGNGAADVSRGGTNATTASGARSNLGLVIGTHVLAPGGDGSGLTGVVKSEVDPVFVGSAAYGVTLSLIADWNAAVSWGDHAAAGYLTSETGDISGVTAGTGLTGGGLTGAVSLAADTTYLQRRVSGECLAGSAIRVINADGTVSCEDDDAGAAIWGGITGLLGDQTDLAGALAAKSDIGHDHAGLYEPGLGLPAADGYVLSSTAAGVRSWVAAGSGSGDMLKSVYDANADNLIDDAAIAASIARDSELPTLTSQLTNDSGFLTVTGDLDDLGDVVITTPAVGHYLTFDGTTWKNDVLPIFSGTVPDGTAANDILQWDGDEWIAHGQIDGLIDDLAGDGAINTVWSADKVFDQLAGKEPGLGLPAADGYVLSSTTAGVRSWVEMSGGSVDLTAPGPIGTGTPDEGHFTVLTAQSFDWGTPPAGETGELQLLEDPVNGGNSVSIKAPPAIPADVTWVLPSVDGGSGQAMLTDGAGTLAWGTVLLPAGNLSGLADYATARTNLGVQIGVNVQGYDADLDDLADGSLSGSKIGTGINGSNITTGTVAAAYLDASMATDAELTTHAADTTDVHGIADTAALALVSQVTAAPVAAPTTATDPCTSGRWAYDSGYVYICVATDTWMRAALASW